MSYGARGSRPDKAKKRSLRVTNRTTAAQKMNVSRSPPSERVASVSLVTKSGSPAAQREYNLSSGSELQMSRRSESCIDQKENRWGKQTVTSVSPKYAVKETTYQRAQIQGSSILPIVVSRIAPPSVQRDEVGSPIGPNQMRGGTTWKTEKIAKPSLQPSAAATVKDVEARAPSDFSPTEREKRQKRDQYDRESDKTEEASLHDSSASCKKSASSLQQEDSKSDSVDTQRMDAIVQRMREFAWMCEQLSIQQLRNQFEALPSPDWQDCKAFMATENVKKNRYSNIPCIDSSRIQLHTLRSDASYGGYIHANRVDYPTLRNKYIITQGPLPSTVSAFWEMIWQENVLHVVMLCQNIEDGKRKCAQYFSNKPNSVTIYAHFTVSLKEQKWEDQFIVSTIELEFMEESRTITHYQWKEWNDYKAPRDNIITLLQKVRGKSTVVVHCSAGVGRSGTFVAIEMCLQDLANGRMINVQQAVISLRRCRALAVQTFPQYLSIFRAILRIGEKHGAITQQDIQHFCRLYDEQLDG
ncbi:unnamed protein product [Cylicocyclus nassatus]|uniref:Uncharacterized protein n=1 Tax=Cylicocyclus nassatus TaxID=53992 RepID=A0AA36DUX2_CYLNA|nr:unnamed protein product [Cylicocyclus nassatus]